jgi:5,10-methenyltetrahydromethanopterin hydrogenase
MAWFRVSGCSVEITFMPVDIVNTYLEVQQLRKEVRKAELDLGLSLPCPPNCSLHIRHPGAYGLQLTTSHMPLLKRARIN